MDVLLNDDETTVRDWVRRFFDSECDTRRVRAIEDGDAPMDHDLWRRLAELGWLGLGVPAAYGGGDAPFTQLALLLEEAGRALAPVPLHPHVVTCLALVAALAKGEANPHTERLLRDACSGKCVLTWAWCERLPGIGAEAVTLSAVPRGDGWRLNGRKRFVEAFELAERCLVAVRTEATGTPTEGITLLLVDPNAEGVSSTPQRTLAGDFHSDVRFDNVHVTGEARIGKLHEGWGLAQPMLEQAVVLNCALIVGSTRRAAERAFAYAKERVAFDHPIASFQAMQHLCADMLTWVDGAELLTREASWRIAQGLDATLAAATAKAFINERCQAVLREANQIHGGYAQVKEFDQQLWYRRASAWTMRMGTSIEHRKTVARELALGSQPPRTSSTAAQDLA